jgi:hypothetical protein
MTDTRKDQINSVGDKAKETVGLEPRNAGEKLGDKAHDLGNQATNKLGDAADSAREAANDAQKDGDSYVSKAVGLVGSVAGGVQDRVIDLKDAALGHGSHAKQTAEQYAEQAKQEAEKGGESGKGIIGSAVGLVGGTVGAVKDRTLDAAGAVLGYGESAKAKAEANASHAADKSKQAGHEASQSGQSYLSQAQETVGAVASEAQKRAVDVKDAALGKK